SLAPDPLERVSLDALAKAARRGMAPPASPQVQTDHVAPIRASVRDAIDTVLLLLPDQGTIEFRDLTAGAREKLAVIVRLLAVLQLYKQGLVDIEQFENFGALTVGPLAAGERVALDLTSLDEWGDEPREPREPADEITLNEVEEVEELL